MVACDEMWTYRGARHGEKREERWIWTAVVAEADGSRWVDFEVGDRSEAPFLRLYARLPEAELYRFVPSYLQGRCGVRGMAAPGPARDRERRRSELERRLAFGVAGEVEPADATNQRVHQEHRDAGVFPGPGVLASLA